MLASAAGLGSGWRAQCCKDRCLRAAAEVRFGAAQHLSMLAKPDGASPAQVLSTSTHRPCDEIPRRRCVLSTNHQANPERSFKP